MATTQCMRVAQWIPTVAMLAGDGIQVLTVTPFKTRPIGLGGGAALPIASAPGQVIVADGALNWVPGLVVDQLPPPSAPGDVLQADGTLDWIAGSVLPLVPFLPMPTTEGDVLQANATPAWFAGQLDGGQLP